MDKEQILEIIKEYNDGLSTYEIAERHNTYANKIMRLLKKHGVTIRNKSDAQKKSIEIGRAKHPTKGLKHSEKTKLLLSKRSQDNWNSLDYSDRERIINGAKERWQKMPESKKAKMLDLANKAIRKASVEGSRLEKLLMENIQKFGYTCHQHRHILDNQKLEVDLFIPELKICIEVDGVSHFEPIHGEDKLSKTIEKDEEKNGLVVSNGFVLIRIKCVTGTLALISIKELSDRLNVIFKKIKKKFPQSYADRLIEIEF